MRIYLKLKITDINFISETIDPFSCENFLCKLSYLDQDKNC